MNEPEKENSNKEIWFKRKPYGWGWVPVTWQGWMIIGLYVVLLVHNFRRIDANSHSVSDTLISFALPFIIATTILIVICYKKGEKPRWQWGEKDMNK